MLGDTCVIAGVIGGQLGYQLLRHIAGVPRDDGRCSASAYEHRSKLEVLFGPGVWPAIEGRRVIDFGCGTGLEAVEAARRGAKRVIGIDVRESTLASARQAAKRAGVSDRCVFTTETDERADVIVSIDGFEHYGEPDGILRTMRRLLDADGSVLIAFGPPWLHPLGGHLFSVFPWAHLVFTERALIRWRADFKSDGATRFSETTGGLNRMTVRRFRQLVRDSDFEVADFEAVPIRRLRRLSNPLTREFVTSVVRCRLVPGGRQGRTEDLPIAATSCAAW
jgi:ubiquinone/menaquinone biosynthesis C-methylase UbiE